MGNIFIEIFKKITILNSILMIIYCFFHPDLGEFEFMFIIMILLLISWIIWLIGKILNYFERNKHPKGKEVETNDIIQTACFKFHQNIDMLYYYCAAAYIIFFARKSIYIDYLMLLLLGLFLGNRIAIKANLYILNRVSKKKINKYTRFTALGLAVIQAIGITLGIVRRALKVNSSFFIFTVIITLVAASMMVMWL